MGRKNPRLRRMANLRKNLKKDIHISKMNILKLNAVFIILIVSLPLLLSSCSSSKDREKTREVEDSAEDEMEESQRYCGDKICDEGEGKENCPEDCFEEISGGGCGDGICDSGEDEEICPVDCTKESPKECGDDGKGGSFGDCGLNSACKEGSCVCGAGWGDCDSDKICECDLSSNVCSEGECVTYNLEGGAKLMSKYSDKEVFLISDKNWRDVLPLVPLTTWTQQEGDKSDCQRGYGTPENVCVYPMLIYHEETNTNLYIDTELKEKDHQITYHPIWKRSTGYNVITAYSKTENLQPGETIDYKVTITANEVLQSLKLSVPAFIEFVDPPDGAYWNINSNCKDRKSFKFVLRVKKNPEKAVVRTFDADSAIYFLQQFGASKITVIGDTPQELDDLLIAQPELGAGLKEAQIKRIKPEDYLDYWESYKNVVYVKEDYPLALAASAYSSLLDAPLIIEGTESDAKESFENRNVVCVGDVSPAGANCRENYNLEELQKNYAELTSSDKILLVNPDDLQLYVSEGFYPEKTSGRISELYGKTSLAAPILAGAKHEIIIPIQGNSVEEIDTLLDDKAELYGIKKGFLTILGTPDAIESLVSSSNADITRYSVLNEEKDLIFDLFPGRIFGISISDISSYISRVIFYDDIKKSNEIVTLAGGFTESISFATTYRKIFESLGYSAHEVLEYETCCPSPVSEDYSGKYFIYYNNHANGDWMGLSSSSLPLLQNTFVFGLGCSTCIYRNHKHSSLMCAQALRKGAVGYWGMLEGGGTSTSQAFVSNLFAGKSAGEATLFTAADLAISGRIDNSDYIPIPYYSFVEAFGLLGDPTLRIDPPYTFPLSEINQIDEDKYEVNLKVAVLPVKFSHISHINLQDVKVDIDSIVYIFSPASRRNEIIMAYNWEYLGDISTRNQYPDIPVEQHRLNLALRLGPLPDDRQYTDVEIIEGFANTCERAGPVYKKHCIALGKEEWIDDKRYVWVFFGNTYSEELPFEIKDTEDLFETVSFKLRLK